MSGPKVKLLQGASAYKRQGKGPKRWNLPHRITENSPSLDKLPEGAPWEALRDSAHICWAVTTTQELAQPMEPSHQPWRCVHSPSFLWMVLRSRSRSQQTAEKPSLRTPGTASLPQSWFFLSCWTDQKLSIVQHCRGLLERWAHKQKCWTWKKSRCFL